ncbi:MAG: PAS domain S-box protein [Proteobacteria bacterium]|nr:PAS domain S-box protein [Pseudomonadota bacterium]
MDDSKKTKQQLIEELCALRCRLAETPSSEGFDLRAVLDGLRTPIFIKDEQHRWIYLNQAATDVVGKSRDEMLGRTDSAVYPPEYVDFLWNKDEYVLSTGKTISYEVSPPWPGGKTHCLTLKSRFTAPGGERYLVGVMQDVTEIKQIQRALRESEGRLRSILNMSRVGVVVSRRDGIVYTNPVMLERSGFAAHEVVGHPVLDFVHPEDRALVADKLAKRFGKWLGEVYYCFRLLKKQGDYRWVGVYGSLVDWDGEPASLTFIVDLSEQKQAEAALARSESRLRRVVDLVPHAIYARHEDGRFLMANKAATELFGCSREELVRGGHDDPGTERVQRSLARLEGPVLSGVKPFQVTELSLQDAFGRTRHLEYSAVPFPADVPGRVVLGVCTDVTSREDMRLRLERFNDCLLHFGSEPEENITSLVALCGEMLGGTCALYNRREGRQLIAAGQWNAPPDMPTMDAAEGHLCGDVISRGLDSILVVRNLQDSSYAESDPNVRAYGLQTYIGSPVRTGGTIVGSLCVVYTKDRLLTEEDEWLLSVVSSAIAVEERRMTAQDSLRQSERTLRALSDATSDMMVLLDSEGLVLAANAKAAVAFGLTPQEMVGRRIKDLHDSPRQHDRWQRLMQVRRADEPVGFTEQRGERSLEHRVYPVLDEFGEVARLAVFTRDITEALLAERKLAESEERFRTTFEQAAVGMAHISVEGNWLRVNDKLCDITGYAREELLGRHFSEVVHPDHLEESLTLRDQMLRGEMPSFCREQRYMLRDGTCTWINVTAACIKDEQGQAKYFSCVVEDIAPRKQIEASLLRRDAVLEAVGLAAEKFLQTSEWTECIQEVLSNLGAAAGTCRAYVFENDFNEAGQLCMSQRCEWCAAGVEALLDAQVTKGLPYAECGIDTLAGILAARGTMHGRVRDLPGAARALLEPQGIKSLALVPVHAGNEWWGFIGFDDCRTERRWLDAEIEALVAAANIVGSAIARKRTELALRESERKFRIIADAVQDVFWISTPDRSHVLYLSPAFERQVGPRDELYRNPLAFAKVVHPDDWRTIQRAYARPRPQIREIEYRVRRRQGDWLWVRERAFPVLGEDGEMEWLAGITIDITERRQAEEEIRRSLKEKELLLQEVHHRVKNNLQIITGLLDMAGRRIKDTKAREVMRDTQSKIHGMAMIHLQLYGFERFDSIDMATYARQLTGQLAQMYGASFIQPQFDLDDIQLPLSKAIPCGLVLSEMLANVFKHAYPEDQGGALSLSVKNCPGGRVMIQVADKGQGIPPGVLESELDSVGLKLLKNIVKFQLSGELRIESDHGTTVTISFAHDEKGESSP